MYIFSTVCTAKFSEETEILPYVMAIELAYYGFMKAGRRHEISGRKQDFTHGTPRNLSFLYQFSMSPKSQRHEAGGPRQMPTHKVVGYVTGEEH